MRSAVAALALGAVLAVAPASNAKPTPLRARSARLTIALSSAAGKP
jgi:hypothetical protein